MAAQSKSVPGGEHWRPVVIERGAHFNLAKARITRYPLDMKAVSPTTQTAPTPDRLALARDAFARYRAMCFWFIRPDFTVTESTIDVVVRGLRQSGDREAFLIADKLCR